MKITHCLWPLITLFLLGPISLSAQTLILLTDDTPGNPYIIGGGTSFVPKRPGIEIELYQAVAKQLNIQLSFKRMPWARCLRQLELNKVDGIFPASFKKERLRIGAYPMKAGELDPQCRTRDGAYFLYKLKGSPISWDGKTFEHATGLIAAPLKWAIVSSLKEKGLTVKEVPIHKDSPNLLLTGRVKGFVCLEQVFDRYIQQNPNRVDQIVKVLPPVQETPYYLMLSHRLVKENAQLAKAFWSGIRDFKHTTDFQAIIAKYSH